MRTASLTRALVPHAKMGLFEVLSGSHHYEQFIYEEPISNLHVLPTLLETQTEDGFRILTSSSFKNLIEELRSKYDYIIIDAESMRQFSRTRAIASLVDMLIFVVEWGKTDVVSFVDTLKAADIPDNVLVGALINKVDAKNYSYFSDETSGPFIDRSC
jgi:succinoglycan biosynthesis transport protein ExoP